MKAFWGVFEQSVTSFRLVVLVGASFAWDTAVLHLYWVQREVVCLLQGVFINAHHLAMQLEFLALLVIFLV